MPGVILWLEGIVADTLGENRPSALSWLHGIQLDGPALPSSVPAPCRTWGNRRDGSAGLRGASGTCRWLCPAASLRALRWRVWTETSAGSGHCKK